MSWRDTFVETPSAEATFWRHLLRFLGRWALYWIAASSATIGVVVLALLRSSLVATGSTYVLPFCLIGGAAGLMAASIAMRSD